MRLSGRQTPRNCVIEAPGFGRKTLTIDRLGFGMSIATNPDGTTRRKRVFYPFVRTSGLWYINAAFSNYEDKEAFSSWLLSYLARATNPHQTTMRPMTVTVPSEGFTKVGYPTSTIQMGDEFGMAVYRVNVGFASASDATLISPSGSIYRHAASDDVARQFYPGGVQSSEYVPPDPIMESRMPSESIWDDINDTFRERIWGQGSPDPIATPIDWESGWG